MLEIRPHHAQRAFPVAAKSSVSRWEKYVPNKVSTARRQFTSVLGKEWLTQTGFGAGWTRTAGGFQARIYASSTRYCWYCVIIHKLSFHNYGSLCLQWVNWPMSNKVFLTNCYSVRNLIPLKINSASIRFSYRKLNWYNLTSKEWSKRTLIVLSNTNRRCPKALRKQPNRRLFFNPIYSESFLTGWTIWAIGEAQIE